MGATFGGIRGIGEGGLAAGGSSVQFCAGFVQVLCRFCAATNGLITPFIGQLQRKHSIFIKRYFKIVYRKRVRKVLCFRCFRCICALISRRCYVRLTRTLGSSPLQASKPVFCSPAVSSREHFWLLICGAGNLRCKMSKSLDILHLSVLY